MASPHDLVENGEDHEHVAELKFRTAIPDLKILPVNYEAPPPETEQGSPRFTNINNNNLELLKLDEIEFSTEDKKRIRGGTIYSIVNYFLTDKDAGMLQSPLFIRSFHCVSWC